MAAAALVGGCFWPLLVAAASHPACPGPRPKCNPTCTPPLAFPLPHLPVRGLDVPALRAGAQGVGVRRAAQVTTCWCFIDIGGLTALLRPDSRLSLYPFHPLMFPPVLHSSPGVGTSMPEPWALSQRCSRPAPRATAMPAHAIATRLTARLFIPPQCATGQKTSTAPC